MSRAPVEVDPHAALVMERDDTFQVHTDAYASPSVFLAEMDRVFEQGWAYVAHESQVANPGDFRTVSLGRLSVIVLRSADGEVQVFLNRCDGCGRTVTRAEAGRVTGLVCGCGRPPESGGRSSTAEDPGAAAGHLQLTPVARVGRHRGLVFVSALADDVMPFAEYLRPVKPHIDTWFDRSPLGTITLLPHPTRHTYPGNWKWQAENGNDAYHGNYVHESWQRVLQRSGEAPVHDVRKYRDEGCTRGFRYGHGLIERPGGMNPNASWTGRMMVKYPEYAEALRHSYGPADIERISSKLNIYVFPNLYLFDTHIRTITPLAVNRTNVDLWVYALDGVPQQLNEGRYRAHERFFGHGGFGTPDDIEIFVACETGMRAHSVEWVLMSRGLQREQRGTDEAIGHTTDETPVRAMYREWRRRIAADR